jgi:hypothetical protein
MSARREAFWLMAGLAVFFLVNFVMAERTPAVWSDEVMYEDPAVNWYQGHGFTSGAWYLQTNDKFWAGNVPLYQLVLYVWLKLFGLSIVSVRSLHYLLMSGAVLAAWAAIRRLRLVTAPAHRLLFCLMACLCTASVSVYRMARPETLAMLLMAFGLLSLNVRRRRVRLALLVLIGGLLTCNGLQFAAYAGVICGMAWLAGLKRFRPETVFLCAGCGLGGFFLYLLYNHHGVWKDFVICIRHHTIANQGTRFAGTPLYGRGFFDKVREIPKVYADASFYPVLALALWMSWGLFRARLLKWRSPLVFGMAACVVVPLFLHGVGFFPIYYFWMAFFPLALGGCAELGPWLKLYPGYGARALAFALVGLACLPGLPAHLAIAAYEWPSRSYGPVMKLAAPYVPAHELVFSEYAAYYAAKQNGARVILPDYFPVLRAEGKTEVSVAILHDGNPIALARDFGGEWREVAAYAPARATPPLLGYREHLGSQEYNLKVFVRSH